ncbi:hypothetical protein BD413DRAFT_490404 [Trametes elegans]|nr:hypothetical protein BD413DRAFT_490404 [Trametes elegans]
MTVTEIIAEQGRAGLSLPSPINMDWQYPDRDVSAAVYLLVFAPTPNTPTRRDLHWSISWPTATESAPGTTNTARGLDSAAAWRHIQVETYDVKTDPAPQPRYVYWGACTKSADELTAHAVKLALGTFPKAHRRRLEELAWETPVMHPNGEWNCQNWVLAFFDKVVADGLVAQAKIDHIVQEAEKAHDLPGT